AAGIMYRWSGCTTGPVGTQLLIPDTVTCHLSSIRILAREYSCASTGWLVRLAIPNSFHSMSSHLSRRDFITFSATAAAMLGFAGCTTLAQNPRKPRPIAPGAKIRMAQIGCGGKGFSDIMAHKDEEVVALCAIDRTGPVAPRKAKA